MKLYNTMTRQKEEFVPMEEGKVKMYVCGPTVYDYIHIGNARPYVVFDTVRRYLEYKGYEVTYVQNFTDVDDKIINRANKEGKTMAEISNKYIEEAFRDADGLNVKRATVHPRVTEEMDGIIAMVQTLIDKGFAYEDHGTVYYDTKKFPEYGKLSRKNLDELIAGASERVTIDDAKKNPTDFVLWKPKKEGEQPKRVINKDWVGRDAKKILAQIGINVGDDIRCIICETEFSQAFVQTELMMPILPIVRVDTFDEAVEMAVKAEHGNRHSAHLHSKNVDHMTQYAKAICTTIFVKNAPSYAGIGFNAEGWTTFTIAGPTGEGITSPRSFTRQRRCVLSDALNII